MFGAYISINVVITQIQEEHINLQSALKIETKRNISGVLYFRSSSENENMLNFKYLKRN